MAIRRTVAAAAAAVCPVLLLAGCAAGSSGGDATGLTRGPIQPGAAKLDPAGQTIEFPISKYGISSTELQRSWRAKDAVLTSCMAAARKEIKLPTVPAAAYLNGGYRFFGVWSLEQAAEYGEELPPVDPAQIAWQAQFDNRGDEWNAAVEKCQASVSYADVDVYTGTKFDLVQRGQEESTAAAENDPAYKRILDAYHGCLKTKGLSNDRDSPFAIADYSQLDEHGQIEAAIKNVECKLDVDLPQGVADIISAYQVRFIAAHEAELVANRKVIDAKIRKADGTIARS